MIAVVIPTYGRPECLAQMLHCLWRSEVPEGFKVFVCIDGVPSELGRLQSTLFPWVRQLPPHAHLLFRFERYATAGEKRDALVREVILRGATKIIPLDDDDLVTRGHIRMMSSLLDGADVVMRKTHFNVRWDDRRLLRKNNTSCPYGAQAFTSRAYELSGGYPRANVREDSELRQRFKKLAEDGKARVTSGAPNLPATLIVRRFDKGHHHISRTHKLHPDSETHVQYCPTDWRFLDTVRAAEAWNG